MTAEIAFVVGLLLMALFGLGILLLLAVVAIVLSKGVKDE